MITVPRMHAFVCALCFVAAARAADQDISSDKFLADATRFLARELEAHVADVKTLDPPQPIVLSVPTGGDFTWGSFMRAITDVTALTDQQRIGGRDVPEFLGKIGLIEAKQGGKTFSQLGAALSLRRFGTDLKTNKLWQSLTPAEQEQWKSLLDPSRFYDRQTRHVINLPENYMGVAARIATMDFQMGLVSDRAFADDVLDRAAAQFTTRQGSQQAAGALYTDDDLPNGRYDRYSQEYARFVYEAAGNTGRKDIQDAVAPALRAVMKTWWDLVQTDGCGYPWGRTIGAMSYMDSMEIVGFLAAHPEFRPAPLQDLASVYFAAWNWLQHDYQPDRHLLNIFGFGRGNYAYMTPARQWQQTTGFLFKSASSLSLLKAALEEEHVNSFPATPHLPDVARFEWFRKGDRPAGVWLARNGRLHFALPITTGVKSGIADYLPAPHALPGFAAPVEQLVPAMVPYLELNDGRTVVASDCADQIEPSDDGKSLRVTWNRFVVVGADPAKFITDTHLKTQVTWALDPEAGKLTRRETISSFEPVSIKRLWVTFPSTADRVATQRSPVERTDCFYSSMAEMEVEIGPGNIPFTHDVRATGNTALGKGARGPIPLILELDARDIAVTPEKPLEWVWTLQSLDAKPPVPLTPTTLPATTATQ